MTNKHKIYDVMDQKFKSFFLNNKGFLRGVLKDGEIAVIEGGHLKGNGTSAGLCAIDMVEEPYDVAYIAKLDQAETYSYIFMDRNFEKIYTHWDDCEDM